MQRQGPDSLPSGFMISCLTPNAMYKSNWIRLTRKLVAAMVVMIVAIMCLLIYFFPKPAVGPHFSPCIENSQVQKNLGFHLRIFYQAKCIRCICSASSELLCTSQNARSYFWSLSKSPIAPRYEQAEKIQMRLRKLLVRSDCMKIAMNRCGDFFVV